MLLDTEANAWSHRLRLLVLFDQQSQNKRYSICNGIKQNKRKAANILFKKLEPGHVLLDK